MTKERKLKENLNIDKCKEEMAIVVMLDLLIFSLTKTLDSYIVMEMKAEGRKFYVCIKMPQLYGV